MRSDTPPEAAAALDARLDDPALYRAWLDGAPGFPPDRYPDGPPVDETFTPTWEDAVEAAAVLAERPPLSDADYTRIDRDLAEMTRLADEYARDFGHLVCPSAPPAFTPAGAFVPPPAPIRGGAPDGDGRLRRSLILTDVAEFLARLGGGHDDAEGGAL